MTYTEEDTFERLLTTGSLPSGPGSMLRGNIDLFRLQVFAPHRVNGYAFASTGKQWGSNPSCAASESHEIGRG